MIRLNGVEIKPTMFPDKTSQVWKLSKEILYCGGATISWNFEYEGEFMHVAQLKHLMDKFQIPAHLFLPYLPYGRQDKPVSNESTFALRTFAVLLNALRLNSVTIVDPHSNVALDFIERSQAFYPIKMVREIASDILKSDVLAYPDKGAVSKYTKIYEMEYIYGEKVRNQSTGQIEKYDLIGSAKDKSVLIVDDLCDGGMTFKLLAMSLLDSGAKEVNLFVTHGIFSRGLRVLHDSGIKRIFTADGEALEADDGDMCINKISYKRIWL